jgi:hypothetical protein
MVKSNPKFIIFQPEFPRRPQTADQRQSALPGNRTLASFRHFAGSGLPSAVLDGGTILGYKRSKGEWIHLAGPGKETRVAKFIKNRKPQTVEELRKTDYPFYSVRTEMRRNLIDKIHKDESFFPDIVGYGETVIPQLENAILSGQDVIFLGERGQAKTRMIRSLVNLLDEEIPVIAGCEINDHPFIRSARTV